MDRKGIEQLLSKEEYKDILEVIYIYSTPKECAERMLRDRGYESTLKRVLNSQKDNEFSNMDIADHIIRNKEGRLDMTKKKLDFIIDNL